MFEIWGTRICWLAVEGAPAADPTMGTCVQVTAFGAWDGELAFVDACLSRDIRNNSAWQHRHVVVRHMLERAAESGVDMRTAVAISRHLLNDTIQKELSYTAGQVRTSAWPRCLHVVGGGSCRCNMMSQPLKSHARILITLSRTYSHPPYHLADPTCSTQRVGMELLARPIHTAWLPQIRDERVASGTFRLGFVLSLYKQVWDMPGAL